MITESLSPPLHNIDPESNCSGLCLDLPVDLIVSELGNHRIISVLLILMKIEERLHDRTS